MLLDRNTLKELWIKKFKPTTIDYSNLFESVFYKEDDVAEIQSIAASSDQIITIDQANQIGGFLQLDNVNGQPMINQTFIPDIYNTPVTFNSITVTGGIISNDGVTANSLKVSTITAGNVTSGTAPLNDYSLTVANTRFVKDSIAQELVTYSVSSISGGNF
jgi:hypothetical protein